ncbi:hypothetical protein [Paenibacillus albiflavus]|uniref:hypothetical protein n=1 Tax=Paenibacillus albiflavus TaxID=2545760 RepID=UPI001F2FA43F|nr:hypothetical protein [Paenibacillus albiflavus]
MSTHVISLCQDNLIGSFTQEAGSMLTIQSGDRLQFALLDASWGTGVSYQER